MERIFEDIDSFDEQDEDEGIEESSRIRKKYKSKTDAILFLIDARTRMFSTEFDGEKSCIIACLKCVRTTIRQKIFGEEKCFAGIILLGTREKKNSLNLGNLTVLQDLSLLEATHILKIDDVIEDIENLAYKKKYGCDDFSLGDAFWLATHMFYEKSQMLNKTIILFTNDDNPVNTEKNDCSRAVAVARDMYKNFILFNLINLGKEFNSNIFYKKLLEESHHSTNCLIPDPVISMVEMNKRARKINYKHLALNKMPFLIGENFKIGVSVYFLIRKMKLPFKVKLSQATNEKVVTKMQLFESETGSLISEDSLIKSQTVGSKNINFNLAELESISNYGSVGLKLLGFKPASVINLENFIKPCAFIYPDETVYKGSSVFFTALLKRCIAKQVVPICTLCLRPKSVNRFVALIGQNELTKIGDEKDLPQGFIGFFLPFAEEIRSYDDDITLHRADAEQVNAATRLIKKLKFKYKIESFNNPKLRAHWAAVEALALDLKEPESMVDNTFPNYDLISSRVGDLANEFMDSVYDEDYDPEVSGAPKKPKSLSSKPAQAEKSSEEVELLIRRGKGMILSNETLKSYLKSVGLGKGLSKVKKSELLERAQKYLEMDI